jgi:hypothetical protein
VILSSSLKLWISNNDDFVRNLVPGLLKEGDHKSGKQDLVSAAGQGIGSASAHAFAKAGAKVHATAINDVALARLPVNLGSLRGSSTS